METELDVKNISISHRKQRILSNISIEFPKGKVSAIVGPSGCGKSSFISCLNSLCLSTPEMKASGEIYWKNKNYFKNKKYFSEIQQDIGTIFQSPIPFPTSIRKNLSIPLKEHFKLSKEALQQEIERVLKEVALWDEVKDKLDGSALKLSGGQRQRLCIARALTLKPRILLMDEPCSALDPISTAKIEELIHKLKKDITIIMVTHNLAQARRVADHVALFWLDEEKGGYLESSGSCTDILNNPKTEISKAFVQGLAG